MQKMKAGASTVHLGQRYPYFYELGTEVAILDATQAGMEVVKTLEGAFAQRYKGILDRFHNTGTPPLALPPPSHGCHNAPARMQHTAIAAHNPSLTLVPDAEDKHASKYLATLTKSERALYHCGKDAVVHRSDWKRRRQEVIEESHISRMTKRQK